MKFKSIVIILNLLIGLIGGHSIAADIPKYEAPTVELEFSNLIGDAGDSFRIEMLKRIWFIVNYLDFEKESMEPDNFLVYGLNYKGLDSFMFPHPTPISDQVQMFWKFISSEIQSNPEFSKLLDDYGRLYDPKWKTRESKFMAYLSWDFFDGVTVTRKGNPNPHLELFKYEDPGPLDCQGYSQDGFDSHRLEIMKRFAYFASRNPPMAIDSRVIFHDFSVEALGRGMWGGESYYYALLGFLSNQLKTNTNFRKSTAQFQSYLRTRSPDNGGQFSLSTRSYFGSAGLRVDSLVCRKL